MAFAFAALCCGAPVVAQANPHELPKTFTTIPAAPADVAPEPDGEDLLLNVRRADTLDASPKSKRRYRKMKVLNYSRDLDVGNEEVKLKVQSPGRHRTIMSLEVKF